MTCFVTCDCGAHLEMIEGRCFCFECGRLFRWENHDGCDGCYECEEDLF